MKNFKTMTTERLIDLFVMTGNIADENIPTVRGWMMDELESRNSEAFEAWLDSETCEDKDLYNYFFMGGE